MANIILNFIFSKAYSHTYPSGTVLNQYNLKIKGTPNYETIPIVYKHFKDRNGQNRHLVFSQIPKYDSYFETSEQITCNNRRQALKKAIEAYTKANEI